MKQRCEPLQWREIERTAGDGGDLPFIELLREAALADLVHGSPNATRATRVGREARRGLLNLAREQVRGWFDSARRPAPAL